MGSELNTAIKLALETHKNGEFREALSMYLNILNQISSGTLSSTIHGNAGSIYLQSGDNEKARHHFTAAVDADPKNVNAHFNLAVLLTSKMSEHAKALKHCGTAIQLDPEFHKGYHLMGNILQTIGKDEDATKFFIMAEELARGKTESIPSDEPPQQVLYSLPMYDASIGQIISSSNSQHNLTLFCISQNPLVFKVANILTAEECEYIVNRTVSQSLMESSYVMGGSVNDQSRDDPYRSSYTSWLTVDDLLRSLQLRVSHLTSLPMSYVTLTSEDLQVVAYPAGGVFKVHQDSSAFHPRLMTALVYLSDAPAGGGGETWFPFAGSSDSNPLRGTEDMTVENAIEIALQHETDVRNGVASRRGLIVQPEKGTAIIFLNHDVSGALNPWAVHAGLPVCPQEQQDSSNSSLEEGSGGSCSASTVATKARKWIANYWLKYDDALLRDLLFEKKS